MPSSAAKPRDVWCNLDLSAALDQRLAEALEQTGRRVRRGETLAGCEIAFGQPAPSHVVEAPDVKWTHLSSAGYTAFDRPDILQTLRGRGAALTKSSTVYASPCADHVIAQMLAWSRQLPRAFSEGMTTQAWPHQEQRRRSSRLEGSTVVLVGFGAIGRCLCRRLAPWKLDIVAIRRRPTRDDPVPTFAVDGPQLQACLRRADHVVNLLPSSPGTEGFFDRDRLAQIRPGAVFYNIGRGTTVDAAALADRLHSGALAAAFLDVTDPEPLPAGHPLWTTPNCFITPHSAGGHHDEFARLVAHFVANVQRFDAGRPLLDAVVQAPFPIVEARRPTP